MIRTSGYYKKEEYGECIENSDFELEKEGWVFQNFKEVTFSSKGAHCVLKNYDAYVIPDKPIMVYPNDVFLIGLSIEPAENSDNNETFYLRIYPFDKFKGYRTDYYKSLKFEFSSSNLHTFYRLFSMSEIFNDYFGTSESPRLIRAIAPWLWFDSDDWDTDEAVYIKTISMRRVKPDDLKVMPIELVKKWVTSGVNKGTYYGDEYFSGIFKEGDYTLFVDLIEDAGEGGLTFSCKIQSYDVVTGQWYDTVVFDDITAAPEANDEIQTKIATAGLGFKQRVKWSLSGSGTPGVVKFKVGVTYKQ